MSPHLSALRSPFAPPGRRAGGGSAARPAHRGAAPPPRWRSVLAMWLENYRARRRLRRCLALDPRFARDIGLTPDDIARECQAPFWTPVSGDSQHMMERARW